MIIVVVVFKQDFMLFDFKFFTILLLFSYLLNISQGHPLIDYVIQVVNNHSNNHCFINCYSYYCNYLNNYNCMIDYCNSYQGCYLFLEMNLLRNLALQAHFIFLVILVTSIQLVLLITSVQVLIIKLLVGNLVKYYFFKQFILHHHHQMSLLFQWLFFYFYQLLLVF